MPYATEADLDAGWDRNTVDLLTVDDTTLQRSPARIAAALANASATIDAYAGRRYPLPLALSAGGALLLAGTCADLAMGRLASSAGKMTDLIEARQKAALDFLRDVAAARADIAVAPDPAAGAGAVGGASITPNEAVLVSPPRLFSRAGLQDL